jgi:hypothetical protein
MRRKDGHAKEISQPDHVRTGLRLGPHWLRYCFSGAMTL